MRFFTLIAAIFWGVLSAEIAQVKEAYMPCEGGQIFYRVIGSGDPIFIIHGGPGLDHSYFLPTMDVLAAEGQVVYYDQRGTGRSLSKVDCDSINMDNFVKDLENLRKHLNCDEITLLGHSWGTLLALEYAFKFPDRVKALILMNSFPATHEGLERYYENLGARLRPISDQLVQIELSEKFKQREPETINKYLQLIFPVYFYDENKMLLLNSAVCSTSAANFFKIGEFLDSDYLGEYDVLDRLKRLSIPTLIVHGDSDPVPKKYAEQLHANIKNSKYLHIGGSGHFPFVEQPLILFKAIREFLTEGSLSLNK